MATDNISILKIDSQGEHLEEHRSNSMRGTDYIAILFFVD